MNWGQDTTYQDAAALRILQHAEYQGLIRDVCANPADDAPRLILADWLEENRQPILAEFIRLQIAGVDLERQQALLPLLNRPAGWLYSLVDVLEENKQTWSCTAVFRRGFFHTVKLRAWQFLGRAEGLFFDQPIVHVVLTDKEPFRILNAWTWPFDVDGSMYPEHCLPGEFGVPLLWPDGTYGKTFDSREEAMDALSRACVNMGRAKAGLPPL